MTTEPNVIIRTDDGLENLYDAADVAEVSDGTLTVVGLDGSQEMMSGSIFGAFGCWKMWHESRREKKIEKFLSEDPLTMPEGFTRFRYFHDGPVKPMWLKLDRAGRIRRLKRNDEELA